MSTTPSVQGFVPVEDKMTGFCVTRMTFKKVKWEWEANTHSFELWLLLVSLCKKVWSLLLEIKNYYFSLKVLLRTRISLCFCSSFIKGHVCKKLIRSCETTGVKWEIAFCIFFTRKKTKMLRDSPKIIARNMVQWTEGRFSNFQSNFYYKIIFQVFEAITWPWPLPFPPNTFSMTLV